LSVTVTDKQWAEQKHKEVVMKIRSIVVFLLVLLASAFGATANAGDKEGSGGGGGWGQHGAYGQLFDKEKLVTVVGKVLSVDHFTPMKGMGKGVELMVKTDQGTVIPVHLGPAWYIDKTQPHIAKGDSVSVHGSQVTISGKPAVIAGEVKKGDKLLKLRDDDGVPVWKGKHEGM